MAVILLIRHGENDYVSKGRLAGRLPGVHLNENGIKQSEALANKLARAPIKAVYASPMERTVETAQPLANTLNIEVVERPGLIEIDFGMWQDKTLKQLRLRKLWRIVQSNPARMRFPEGESFTEAQSRIIDELETLARTHKPDDMIACVSHSDIIKLTIAHYMGIHIDLFQRIMIDPASVTTLMINDLSARIISINIPIFSITSQHPQKKKTKK